MNSKVRPTRFDARHGTATVRSRRGRAVASVLLLALLVCAALLARGSTPADAAAGLPGQGFLPDNRAWEMVSPVDKGGHDISPNSWRVRPSSDGEAVTFVSLGGFLDSLGNTAYGTEYMALRGDDGWVSHGITPPQNAPQFVPLSDEGFKPAFQGDFSSDFDTGVFQSGNGGLTDEDPNVDAVSNLYLRDDLRTPGNGDYTLLTKCPDCSGPLPAESVAFNESSGIAFAGASEDFEHIIFESTDNLTGETTGNLPKLYEWLASSGEIRLVAVLPDDACGTPPCLETGRSNAGNGAGGGPDGQVRGGLPYYSHAMNAISRDGSRIFFTAQVLAGTYNDQNGVSPRPGELYFRDDGETTTKLNVSERTDCAGDPSCGGDGIPDLEPDPAGHKLADWGAASADGSVAYFLTAEQMTDDDTDAVRDLYRADLEQPAGERLTLISGAPEPRRLVAISDDGEYVHYTSEGNSGNPDLPEPGLTSQLIVWHNGDGNRAIADYARQPSTFRHGYHWGEATFSRYSGSRTLATNGLRVTPDGRHAIFISPLSTLAEETAGYDNTRAPDAPPCGFYDGQQTDPFMSTTCMQVYLYDYESDDLTCLSCGPDGILPRGDSRFDQEQLGGPIAFFVPPLHMNKPISDDGSVAWFSTPNPLVPEDTNGRTDVYQYDVETGEHSLLSTGTADTDAWFMDATPNGDSAFFTTRERLVGVDADDSIDLYVARRGGGLAGQSPSPPSPACEGDDCQGEPSAPPADQAPSSGGFSGTGNPDQGSPSDCRAIQGKATKRSNKAKRLKRRARSADGKRAQRLKKKAKRATSQARKAKRKLRNCRKDVR